MGPLIDNNFTMSIQITLYYTTYKVVVMVLRLSSSIHQLFAQIKGGGGGDHSARRTNEKKSNYTLFSDQHEFEHVNCLVQRQGILPTL